ncbi:MAG: flagellar filament capping protein FliD [Lautropia sp.]|nr:flagellar filament capping protein FliD [Lautropia sp.]
MAAAITAAGGSLDVNGIVSQLMAIEREPLAKIKQQQSGINTKLSSWGKVKSALSELQTAAEKLTNKNTWQNSTAKSSNEGAVVATGGSGGAKGMHSLVVKQLAQSQAVATRSFEGPDALIGGGTLSIQLGSVNADGTTFTADAERPALDITVPSGATLKDIRDLINNNSKAGVNASLVNDGTGTRLMLSSRETGAKHAFEVTATPRGDSRLASFSLSATAPTSSNGSQRTQVARDAELSFNGLNATSSSNKVTDLIEGVTLDLKKADTNPVSVEVDTNTESLKEDVENFIKAYNKVNSLIAEETKYDAGSKTAGTLQGNATVIRIQNQLRSLVRAQPGDDDNTSLSKAGFELGRDGSLSIKGDKLDALLSDPSRLRNLLAGQQTSAIGAGSTTAGAAGTGAAAGAIGGVAPAGLAKRLADRLKEILDPKGSINGATEMLNRQLKAHTDKHDRISENLVRREEQLRKQYAALDANITKITNSFSSIAAILPR